MRLVAVLSAAVLATGCATYFRSCAGFPVSQQRAIQIASDELRRRAIALSPSWPVDAFEDVAIVEAAPEIPLYVVQFHAPGGRFGVPRYRVSMYKYGGGVRDFLDSADLRR